MPVLITKLPKEKKPCICICFESVFEAGRFNQDLVNMYGDDIYSLKLIPIAHTTQMNLMLISNNNQRLYHNVEYDYHKLNQWLLFTKKAASFSFVHIIKDFDLDRLVITSEKRKRFILQVGSYQLINEENLSIGY